jgi:DNA-binding transcriptional ArsR family regulator
MPSRNITAMTDLGKALSDANRVRALMALRRGERCVCQLIELLGLAPSTVSKHMTILRQAGLVESRKDSRWVYYRLASDPANELARALSDVIIAWLEKDAAIREDDRVMKKIAAAARETVCTR